MRFAAQHVRVLADGRTTDPAAVEGKVTDALPAAIRSDTGGYTMAPGETIPPDFGHIDPGSPIPTGPLPSAEIFKEMEHAHFAIKKKARALGGAPGRPKGNLGAIGLIRLPDGGFIREFTHGRMFFNRSVAEEAFWVHRADPKYAQLGGPAGRLGWPVSDDIPDHPQEPTNVVTRFQNGAIYWWPDIGAIEQLPVAVTFVGLFCFRTTSGAGSDEPYVTVGALSATGEHSSTQTQVFEDVDSGEAHEDALEVYRGTPFGLNLSVILSEHDEGDPHKYKDEMANVVNEAGGRVAEAIGSVPGIGPMLMVFAKFGLALASPTIGEKLSELLGTDDDFIGSTELFFPAKELMRLAISDDRDIDNVGIVASFASDVLRGDDGIYKLYFSVTQVTPKTG